MPASIATQRLRLVPLTFSQLRLCLMDLPELEAELGLSISRDVLTERVQRAIQMKLIKMANTQDNLHLWQTYWLIVLQGVNFGAGLAGFKGVPDENGSIEIGYGIDPAHQNKGYMGEAVQALVAWAFQHRVCKTVTASEVENPASRRLLEKLGARLVDENGTSTSWEFTR